MIDRPPTREEVLAYNKWLGLSDPPPMVAPSPPTSSTKPRVGPLTLPPPVAPVALTRNRGSASMWIDWSEWRSRKYPEKRIHQSRSGEFVRSKSEMAIADLLWARRIAFIYEPLLHDSSWGPKIQPDFLVIREDGALFYWEHCGMSTYKYKKDWDKKLTWYYDHGIYDHHDKWFGPHGTLVVTKDDGKYLPLSTFQLDKWIDPWYTVEVPGELLNAQRNLTNWKAP